MPYGPTRATSSTLPVLDGVDVSGASSDESPKWLAERRGASYGFQGENGYCRGDGGGDSADEAAMKSRRRSDRACSSERRAYEDDSSGVASDGYAFQRASLFIPYVESC